MELSQTNYIIDGDLAIDVLDKAKKLGASNAEVCLHTNSGFSLSVRQQNIDTLEYHQEKNLEIIIYFGNCQGRATSSDFSQDSINQTIEKASYIARFTEADACLGLADIDLMAFDYPELDLHHPWKTTIDEVIELAKNLEASGLNHSKKIVTADGVFIDSLNGVNLYANTHGFVGTVNRTKHSVGCSFIAEDCNKKERDSYCRISRKIFPSYFDIDLAKEAAQRTVNRLGSRKLTTKKSPVIFFRDVAISIIKHFIFAIAGSNLYRKSSFLVNSLNKSIFPGFIDIIEDPFILGGLGSTPFDGEGVKLSRNNLVIGGKLDRYLLDSYTARKLNLQTTGNSGGAHNLIVKSSSDSTLDNLITEMGTGLMVTELLGGDVNITTGNYSRGAFGYWVENGAIAYPVTGITIAGNLKDIFSNIIAIGNDLEYSSNILVGSILVEELAIAGS